MRRPWRHVDLRVAVVVAASVLVAAVLAGWSLRVPDPPATAERTPPVEGVGPGGDAAKQPRRLVALGDFWAAGPGLPGGQQPSAEEEQCGRSPASYSHLAAAELGLALIDRACAGAGPEEVARGGRTDAGLTVPPQIDALSRRTDVVTISVGAEDDDLFDRTVAACQELADLDPQSDPCRRAFGDVGLAEVRSDATAAGQRVGLLLREVARRAPDARVLLVGYANPFPGGASCFARSGVSDGDIDYLRQAAEIILTAVRLAARSAGVEYVDPQQVFAGHQLCSRAAYVTRGTSVGGPALRLTAAGHRALASLVVETLGGRADPQ